MKFKVISIEPSNSEVDKRPIASFLGACEALDLFIRSGHFLGHDETSGKSPRMLCFSIDQILSQEILSRHGAL